MPWTVGQKPLRCRLGWHRWIDGDGYTLRLDDGSELDVTRWCRCGEMEGPA